MCPTQYEKVALGSYCLFFLFSFLSMALVVKINIPTKIVKKANDCFSVQCEISEIKYKTDKRLKMLQKKIQPIVQ